MDLDDVCISNVNRQLHALDGELGKPKVEVMARRVQAINPECAVHPLQSFFLKSNAVEILEGGFDAVLDAIDSPSLKALLMAECRERGIPVVTTGAAGGRRDPTAIEVIDLAFSSHDRLLQEVRRLLRSAMASRAATAPFGVECVVSREQVVYPDEGRLGLRRSAPKRGPAAGLRQRLRHGELCDGDLWVRGGVADCQDWRRERRIRPRPKPEGRNPKEVRNPKAESRKPQVARQRLKRSQAATTNDKIIDDKIIQTNRSGSSE